jgi:hypothetical protein
MPHDDASFARLHCFIWPEVAAANAGTSDSDECVCRVENARVRHVLDPNITGLIHNSCFHDLILFVLIAAAAGSAMPMIMNDRKTTMTGNVGITNDARLVALLRVFNFSVKADIVRIAPASVIDDLVIARERCIPRP